MSQEEQPQQWQLRNLSHAYQQRQKVEFVVEGMIQTASLSTVYGAPSSYKSMMLADLCAHVVAGTNWMPGGADVPTVKGNVLWIDMDNGTRRTDERIDAICKAHNLPMEAGFYYISMPTPPLIAHDINSMILLRDAAWECQAKLIVIDNLGLITGDVDENSSQMAMVMGNLRTIAERTGAAIVVIHHQRKGGANGARAGDALRGHSSIEASLDLALLVVREAGSRDVRIIPTKTRGADVPVISGTFHFEQNENGDLSSAYFAGIPSSSDREGMVKLLIDQVLQNKPLTKTLLANRVKEIGVDGVPGVNVIRGIIDQMLADGELVEHEAKGNKKVVDLP